MEYIELSGGWRVFYVMYSSHAIIYKTMWIVLNGQRVGGLTFTRSSHSTICITMVLNGHNCVMLSSHATLYETILMILSGQTVGGLTVLWLHL